MGIEAALGVVRARWLDVARSASVAVPVAFAAVSPGRTLLATAALAASGLVVLARWLVRDESRWVVVAEAAVASVAIAATGSLSSPLIGFGVVAAVAAGVRGGAGLGAIAGTIVTAASVPALAHEAAAGIAATNHVATWIALYPLAGVAAGLAARVLRSPTPQRAAEDERRRIARDLHDGVAQTLAHLRLELDMLAHPKLANRSDPEDLQRLARLAERTLGDVRLLIEGLGNGTGMRGLVAELRTYAAEIEPDGGPSIVVRGDGDVPARHPARQPLFRVAQEAISNAVRHSGASRVEVLVEHRGGTIRLVVADDGSGAVAERRGGVGLSAMRERAATLGGTLSIEARPAVGTRITVELSSLPQRHARIA